MGEATQVTISGVSHWIYGERDANGATAQPSAGEWLGGSIRWATIWAALTPDNQARCLVEATRFIDTLPWAGTKTSGAQPLKWPRTSVTRSDGTAVDAATVPDEVVYATYELAAAVSQKPDLFAAIPGAAGNIKKVEGGPASVEFFRPLSSGVLPQSVVGYLSQFLAGAGDLGEVAGGIYATGTTDASVFDDDDAFTVGEP